MVDDVLRIAAARRKVLLEEVARIDDFLSMARSLRSSNVDESAQPLWRTLDNSIDAAPSLTSASEIVGMVEQVLRSAGRPLTRSDLYRRLRMVGVHVPGVDPVKNLGTMLWRSGRFDNTGRRYWLKDEPRPK